MPKLRFKGKNGGEFPEWEQKFISEIAVVNPKSKKLPSEFIYIDLESVEKGRLLKEQLIYKDDAPSRAQRLLQLGDVLFQLVRPYQNNNYLFLHSGNYVASTGYAQLRAKNNPEFLYQLLHLENFTSEVMNRCTGTSYPAINSSDFASIEVDIPCESEQIKIANFLSAVDKKITLLNKQYDLLLQYKKGMMQKIFSQELRFKDENGEEFPEWEEMELKEIASKVNTKNRDNSVRTVLTNSATQGIVSQESYFERDIVTEGNLTGYYVVNIGDFVYNPRISSTAPVGPIKMNELIQGIMSPLYTVFRFEKGLLKFYQYFFASSVWHDYMKSIANSGARHDRMNISGADFFGLPVPQPVEEEQTKIANFLSAIDDKITAKKTELDKLKIWKQGLLQQMFV
ncbi:restriction endonuclease subunit S [Xenorhabdus bovienii]|uniref:restriction endonuclease subunit S n=3 Tax=Xenorhabdus bovienii TaxID=40576 RepID=UPI00237C5AB5|nr:restriction endonuclease subunit S [Xenorhabdus bovienii]MDE1474501.1 restriction endonuclease subunit S [Xenorhabdus bovienii]MDE9458172.1 restriction endonuclease subunit S [Xenorhabdus bovienii]MDE9466656.1 restriction endonuclease subunit S [Xenorhabdus bovienii]MDE9514238.1 restriction endonuclease subunit S [Xenorhabdus bovienii]MDE9540266.1 restriction endonuclease subunit S [Xenorhabdus bovienii]